MGVRYDARGTCGVRWNADGRRRVRRFESELEVIAFAESVASAGQRTTLAARPRARRRGAPGRGAADESPRWELLVRDLGGTRCRFTFRQSGGTMFSRRGFTSRKAAADATPRLLEGIRRGEVRVSRDTFETFWHRVLGEEATVHDRGFVPRLRHSRAEAADPVLRR